jgi:hypothetical protein
LFDDVCLIGAGGKQYLTKRWSSAREPYVLNTFHMQKKQICIFRDQMVDMMSDLSVPSNPEQDVLRE